MSSSPEPTTPPAEASPADCAARLKALFPALFGAQPKPLKLKIQADLQQRAPGQFSKQALSAFFRRYTGSTAYLIALTRAPHRFDLDGQPAGEISEEHRNAATDELARRRALQRERRAQEDEARRQRIQLLRDHERTTLTRANFCALKGVPESELDALLARAREEAAALPPPRSFDGPPRGGNRRPPRGPEGQEQPQRGPGKPQHGRGS